MDETYKFGWVRDVEVGYRFPDVFCVGRTKGPDRLVVAPTTNHVALLFDLLQVMTEPFWILYVLTAPRTEAAPGRYQTVNPLSREEVRDFLEHFREFLEKDGRHNVWLKSTVGSDLLVYDKHNVIYAYGQLSEFKRVALNHGLASVNAVHFPSPHVHRYHDAFDSDERSLLQYLAWNYSPLHDNED